MARKKAVVKPSRLRYEESHPTVSFRVSRPVFEQLKAATRALGYSFAGWVKAHLDQDERRSQAVAETLAQERDGLGREIDKKRLELYELGRRIEERSREATTSVEEEKARRLKDLDQWYIAQKAYGQRRLALAQANLDRVHAELSQEQNRLQALRQQVAGEEDHRARLEAANEDLKDRLDQQEKEMAAATRLTNQFPWLFCQQCPGSPAVLINDLARRIASSSPQTGSPSCATTDSQGSESAVQTPPQAQLELARSGTAEVGLGTR